MVAPMEIGLNVRDLKKMRAFYEDALGLAFVNEIHVPAEKARQAALSGGAYVVVRLQASNGERLKLLAAESPVGAAAPTRFILDQPNSLYVTFIIDDIRAACERLRTHDVAFMTGREPVEVRPGTWLVFFRDPEGNVIELVEYDDVTAYRPDLKRA
jgi:catechol 2,3-dioxygenase-like lactoylglutathione lyase family enzyme